MTKKKTTTKKVSKSSAPAFRPLVAEGNKFKPVEQIYNGFEIEKRWVLRTVEEDYTKKKNALGIYNETLEKGTPIEQGYIIDIDVAKDMLEQLNIEIDFKPNTIRLRKYGPRFILTLKDRKETKRREVEWELDKKTFMKFWKLTKGKRVKKVRLEKTLKGHKVEFDAFTDRFLLLAEIEVQDEAALDKLPNLGFDVTGNKAWTNKSLSK